MLGARRPARIHKTVMKVLLNIVHDSLLEIRQVVAEQSEAGNGLGHDRFITGSNGHLKIMLEQANDTVSIGLRDWAVGFSPLSLRLARRTVRHPVSNHHVTLAEHIRTHDAETADVIECPERLPTCEAGSRRLTLTPPHSTPLFTSAAITCAAAFEALRDTSALRTRAARNHLCGNRYREQHESWNRRHQFL